MHALDLPTPLKVTYRCGNGRTYRVTLHNPRWVGPILRGIRKDDIVTIVKCGK